MERGGTRAVGLTRSVTEGGATDLLIVARNQPGLYEYLQQDFAHDADVRVIMDRRVRERRRRAVSVLEERRRGDRRTASELADRLTSIGFAIVRRDEAATA